MTYRRSSWTSVAALALVACGDGNVRSAAADVVFTVVGPCDGVHCSGHGVCLSTGVPPVAVCSCDDGFLPVGLECEADLCGNGSCDASESGQTCGVDCALHWNVHDVAQAELPHDGLAFRDDIFIFYEHQSGQFPGIGVPRCGPDYTAEMLASHLTQWRADVRAKIPADATGYGVIDLEAWQPRFDSWYPASNCWQVTLGRTEDAYNDAARTLMEATIRAAIEERPQIKWGYWDAPVRWWFEGFARDPYERYFAREIESMDWLWQLQGAYYPSFYARKFSTEAPQNDDDWTPAQTLAFLHQRADVTQAAIALGGGGEVLAYLWFEYESNPTHVGIVSALDWQLPIDVARARSFDGLVVWGYYPANAEPRRTEVLQAWRDVFYPKTLDSLR